MRIATIHTFAVAYELGLSSRSIVLRSTRVGAMVKVQVTIMVDQRTSCIYAIAVMWSAKNYWSAMWKCVGCRSDEVGPGNLKLDALTTSARVALSQLSLVFIATPRRSPTSQQEHAESTGLHTGVARPTKPRL